MMLEEIQNMTDARTFVREFLDRLVSMGASREVAIDICRTDWTEQAKRVGFAWEITDNDMSTVLPMILTALDQL